MKTRSGPWLISMAALVAMTSGSLVPASGSACNAEAGKTLYTINCMTCHGDTGKGDGPVGIALNPRPRDFSAGEFVFDPDGDGTKGSDADLKEVIAKGAATYGGSPLMAPWAHLPPQDIENLICYVRTLQN